MILRTATRQEVALCLDWAADEGWNPGLDDAAVFFESDPDGFFVAEVDGIVVAAISVVNHSGEVAFLGLYLCRADRRGLGIGYALWQHAVRHAGGRTIGLDGVADQQANYAKSGFVRTGATTRLEGALPDAAPVAVHVLSPEDIPTVARLDRGANGYARPGFLSGWLTACDSRKTVVLDSGDGFATARLCRDGAKIGPVVAPDTPSALSLVRACAKVIGASPLFIDLPERRGDFRAALERQGFTATFETARMYRGAPPREDDTLHAIATMELG